MSDDKTIEKFARQLIIDMKGDPDQIVQPGSPTGYGTPSGDCFAVTPGAAVPLWRLYLSMAKRVLELARQIDGKSDAAEKANGFDQYAIATNPPKELSA